MVRRGRSTHGSFNRICGFPTTAAVARESNPATTRAIPVATWLKKFLRRRVGRLVFEEITNFLMTRDCQIKRGGVDLLATRAAGILEHRGKYQRRRPRKSRSTCFPGSPDRTFPLILCGYCAEVWLGPGFFAGES
jgi:hypothetical protein